MTSVSYKRRQSKTNVYTKTGSGCLTVFYYNLEYDQIDDSLIDKKALPPDGNFQDYLYGSEAFKNYSAFMSHEQTLFDGVRQNDIRQIKEELQEKKEKIMEALEAAKGKKSDCFAMQ